MKFDPEQLDPKHKLRLTYPEACALLGMGETKLRKEIKAGRITPDKEGTRFVRFPIEEIYRWCADRDKGRQDQEGESA